MFADPEFQDLVKRHRALSENLGRGLGLDGKDTLELADVTNRIKYHSLHRKGMASLEAMIALLREVNEVISDQLWVDFASNAAPPRGSCCG